MATPAQNVSAAAADPEARSVWVIVVVSVLFLVWVGRTFR